MSRIPHAFDGLQSFGICSPACAFADSRVQNRLFAMIEKTDQTGRINRNFRTAIMSNELVKVSSAELKNAATEAVTVLRQIQGDESVSASVRVSAAKAVISTALEVQREADRNVTANELDLADLDQLIASQRSAMQQSKQ